ncbi:MAG: DNA topoisomerase IB [Actinomycetota bacterium]
MRLRRVSLEAPGIVRRRRGSGFSYEHPSGRAVDEETLERIRALAIPPAWKDVWISPHPNGHIQAVGTDAAGRRQYQYHDRWRAHRDAEKFERMRDFGRALPALRERVDEDLRRRGVPRDKALACAVRLLDLALFRVGTEPYTKQNGSHGLATIRKDHVRISGRRILFDFDAKSGVRQRHELEDAAVLPAIRTMRRRRNGSEELLAYREGSTWRDLRAADINDYVREAMGGDYTAKDFRTWHATVLAAVSLARKATEATNLTSRRRLVSSAVREVAEQLGNTPAVARASYVDPRVIDRFEQGETIALQRVPDGEPSDPAVREPIEAAVLELLEDGDGARARAA